VYVLPLSAAGQLIEILDASALHGWPKRLTIWLYPVGVAG
jgi:hypothetical protein